MQCAEAGQNRLEKHWARHENAKRSEGSGKSGGEVTHNELGGSTLDPMTGGVGKCLHDIEAGSAPKTRLAYSGDASGIKRTYIMTRD